MATTKFVTSEGTDKKEVKDALGNVVEPAVITRKIECEFDFGSNLEEAVALFGAEVVYTSFVAAAKVDAQALVRRYLKSNVPASPELGTTERPFTDDEIKSKLAEWKPGVKTERAAASVTEKAEALLGKMTEEQKKAFIESLMAAAQG